MRNFSFNFSISFKEVFPYLMLILMLFTFCLFSYAGELPEKLAEDGIELLESERFNSPPEVSLLEPTNRRNFMTSRRKEVIKAYIKDVRNEKDIKVTVNGKERRSVKYKKRKNMLIVKVKLDKGTNFVRIAAKNKAGRDSEAITIFRKRNSRR